MKGNDVVLAVLNKYIPNTLMEVLGIVFTDVGEDYLCGCMPVDNRTMQPFGILHGGASLALAETLGSAASAMNIDQNKQTVVGLEIKANHVKTVNKGYVYGKATPVHLGRRTQLWNIDITNDNGELISTCRITNMIIDKD